MRIWTQISENERYHVAEQLDGWVKIEFDERRGDGDDEISAAYVSSEFVEVRYALSEAIKFSPTEESASLRSRIVNYAMKFLGNPYVWGGTSLTKGADCSGFTKSVMKNFGISLPHYSGSQARAENGSSRARCVRVIWYSTETAVERSIMLQCISETGRSSMRRAAGRDQDLDLELPHTDLYRGCDRKPFLKRRMTQNRI